MRYLTRQFAINALRRGRAIEQFLGGYEHGEQHLLRWVRLSPDQDRVTVHLHEVVDWQRPDFYDVYEFSPVDPDSSPEGEIVTTATSPEQALEFAEHNMKLSPERWVNDGIICDEYRDYRTAVEHERLR